MQCQLIDMQKRVATLMEERDAKPAKLSKAAARDNAPVNSRSRA